MKKFWGTLLLLFCIAACKQGPAAAPPDGADGADADDRFHAKPDGTLGALTEGGALTLDGDTVGTVTTNSDGTLALTFATAGAYVSGDPERAELQTEQAVSDAAPTIAAARTRVRMIWVSMLFKTGACKCAAAESLADRSDSANDSQ